MNIILAFIFGLLRTPALLYFAVTGVVVYAITNVIRLAFLPLKFLNTNMPHVYGIGMSLFILVAVTHGFLYLKDAIQPLLDSNLFVTVPTIILTFESMTGAVLEGFYMLEQAAPTPQSMFDWSITYLMDWDIKNILITWWVVLASQFGPLLYYICHRFFYIIGME